MSNELMEEIREDVRREELVAFWQNYWRWIVGGLATIVVLTTGYIIWKNSREKDRNEQTYHYEKALNYLTNKQTDQALNELNILSKIGDASYLTLSLFKQTGIMVDNNAVLQTIIDDSKIDESLRQLATLVLVERLMNLDDYSSAIKKLAVLVNANSPWRASAQELMAVALYKTGATQKAMDVLQLLSEDQAAPSEIRLRAHAFNEFIRAN